MTKFFQLVENSSVKLFKVLMCERSRCLALVNIAKDRSNRVADILASLALARK